MKPCVALHAIVCLCWLSTAARAEGTLAAAWPPAEMRNLPADYLDRLRAALQVSANRFSEQELRSKQDVVRVRVAVARLALNQDVENINTWMEADGFGYEGSDKWGFSLFSLPYFRLYGLYNDRTGTMTGRLSPKAQTNLAESFWKIAKVNGEVDAAKIDVWESDGSENHHVTSRMGDFLAARFLKDIPEYAALKYDDGSTPREQYDAWRGYWSRWIDERAKRGLLTEDGSSYENYTIEAFLNLRDFAEDAVLRRKADMFLDLLFVNMAEETLGSVRGGPKSRTKEEGFEAGYYTLLFNQGTAWKNNGDYILPTSGYHPSPAIVELGELGSQRGVYGWSKRCPGFRRAARPGDPGKWKVFDNEVSMIRDGFAGHHYLIGSHAVDTTAEVDAGAPQQRWQGIVFANHPLAHISMDGKYVRGVGEKQKSGYLSNPFKTIQDRNIAVTVRWDPNDDERSDRNLWIYFSHELDHVEEEDGWIFVKSGEAFAGVMVVGGHTWTRPWSERNDLDSKSFARANQDRAPIITVVNDAADYANDFRTFKNALKSRPLTYSEGILRFATITHEGPSKPGKIHGQDVDLHPSRLNDSPFIRSVWNSGVSHIRVGNQTLKLDFSDPDNPVRTVDAPLSPEFPPGVGTASPIVF